MAETESLTPEKQLLKLIENPKQAAVKAESVKRESKKWFSLAAFKGRFAFWKGRSANASLPVKRQSKSTLGIQRINLALKVLLALMVLYTGYSVWQMAVEVRRASNLILKPEKMGAGKIEPAFGLPTISYYLEKIKDKGVFSSSLMLKKEVVKIAAPAPPVPNLDIRKEWSLVGIAWSDDPEAMIEDQRAGRTLFLRRGQVSPSGVRVVAIFKDKVILNYNDEEFELR